VPEKNCIGIAALETLKLIGQPSCGVALTLNKAWQTSQPGFQVNLPM
jgi:hypothetical protein